MNKNFTFHLLGLVHLPVTKKYCHCAFTQKVHKLTRMLLNKGHTVFLYGTGYTDIEHKNLHFIQCATISDIRKEWGQGDNRYELGYNLAGGFRHDINKPISETRKKFNANAIKHINLNKKPDHFLLLSQGSYQKSIADNVDLYLKAEFGIGYRGSYAKFRAFESSYIQNFTYGSENPRQSINGRYYDRVIPNYFEKDLFTFNNKPEDYLCYLGRIIERKGISTAMKPKDRFQRFPSSRTDAEMDQFRKVFTDWTDDIERDVEKNYFPMKTNYCSYWGKKCKFWELCVYGVGEKYIEQNFIVDETKGGGK